jgi:hypothetical protein
MQDSGAAKRSVPLAGAATAIVGAGILVNLTLSTHAMGDYVPGGPAMGDNAAPGLAALLHGHLSTYTAHQPAIGLTSILLRLPFAAAAQALGGGDLLVYQVGALACLLPLALLAGWLVARCTPRRLAALLAGVLLITSPAVWETVSSGHPEDVLAAVLATAAVLAATRGRAVWAAAALGLAVGTKEWAVIAVLPVLLGLPGRRLAAAAIAGVIAAVLCLAAPLADPAAFTRALHTEGTTNLVNPLSLWWPVSASVHLASGALAPARLMPFGLSRAQSSLLALAIGLGLLAAYWWRAGARRPVSDPLALLALFALVRLFGDSTHLVYYYVALVVPLAAWEVVSLERLPWVTACATVAVGLIPRAVALGQPELVWAVSTVATLAVGWYLASHAFMGRGNSSRARESAQLVGAT